MTQPNTEPNVEPSENNNRNNRRHFLVDINTVLNLFGKRFFLIFYFGRHLHPRQQSQVNQRTMGNWLVIMFVLLLVVGSIYGAVQMVMWRIDQGDHQPGSFTQLVPPAPLNI